MRPSRSPRGLTTASDTWAVGDKITGKVIYSLDAPATTSIRTVNSGYGYNAQDLLTSPTVQWNETVDQDLSPFIVTGTLQYFTFTEPVSAITTTDYIQHKFAPGSAGAVPHGAVPRLRRPAWPERAEEVMFLAARGASRGISR